VLSIESVCLPSVVMWFVMLESAKDRVIGL
jgi:hypothetical protein